MNPKSFPPGPEKGYRRIGLNHPYHIISLISGSCGNASFHNGFQRISFIGKVSHWRVESNINYEGWASQIVRKCMSPPRFPNGFQQYYVVPNVSGAVLMMQLSEPRPLEFAEMLCLTMLFNGFLTIIRFWINSKVPDNADTADTLCFIRGIRPFNLRFPGNLNHFVFLH